MASVTLSKAAPGGRKALWREMRKNRFVYLLFAPVLLWFVVFRYVPMFGLVIAFWDYSIFRGIWASAWVGLNNFERAFNSPAFLNALIGGIEPVFFERCGMETLEARVHALLALGKKRRYVLANSDSCPPGVEAWKFRAVSEMVRRG